MLKSKRGHLVLDPACQSLVLPLMFSISERLEGVAALAEPGCSSQTLSKHGINSSVFAKACAGLLWWEEDNNSTRRGWLGGEACQGGNTSTCVICHEEVVAAAE